ncbi:MAG: PIN domain nuclease [Gammaproteobacteria bacterium]|uniref:type II toxin-antitoxin system VapC family toxin n=1 Tax=Pseudomaricurvus alcaniphilus TaxID=1166482 RepID=UPI001407BB62|nr:PIN domain nuclease [Gammaproteobacteria bacterium]NHN39126.1 PIN domain nuclease [Pseudomaricurvus alcaniphilus]
MIVVDTSVWIDYFNGRITPETERLDSSLGNSAVAAGDLIVLEILQGFRSDKDYKTAKKYLASLHQYNMLTPDLAIKGAENYRKLRKKGITIRKTADVIIATFCIEHRLPLLYTDKDFLPFTHHLKLRSVLEKS